MKWSRACWSNRHQNLFGSRKDWHSLQRHQLKLYLNIWCDALRAGVYRSKLGGHAIILSRNNDAIAKWLDSRYDDRANTGKP